MTEANVIDTEKIQLSGNENDEDNISSVEDASLADDDFQLVSKKRKLSRKCSTVSSKSEISLVTTLKDDENNENDENDENNENNENTELPNTLIGPNFEEICEIMYGQKSHQRAVWNLIFFSVMMFTVPFAAMYFAYLYFMDYLHLPASTAMLYGGIVGAVVVYMIVAIFVWVAYREEKLIAAQVEETTKKKDE